MEATILIQLISLLIYIVSGIIIGVLFDFFRILRKSFYTPDLVTYLEDIIFWILTGIFLLYVLFKIDNGEIRIYSILGLLFGFVFYMFLISKHLIKISVAIVTIVKNIIIQILNVFIFPIKIILKMLKRLIKPITFFVINIKKSTIKFSKKLHKSKYNSKDMKKMSRERRILKRNVEKYK